MIGARGVPAAYSGVERAVESLGAALVARGHQVTVFCRREHGRKQPPTYRGMRLRYVPAPRQGGVATFLHSALSTVCALRGYDIVHYNALGPNLFSPLARWLSPAGVVTTVHGRDDQRAKWGPLARCVLSVGAHISARVPHTTVVVSQDLRREYATEFGRKAVLLLNSLDPVTPQPPGEELRRQALRPGQYVTYIGRLVAEKDVETLLSAYRRVNTPLPLLVVAERDDRDPYVKRLVALAAEDVRVRLIGARHGSALAELFTNAGLYVTASTLEGMPFALSEAVQYRVPVVATDIGPHWELLGGGGPGRRLVPVRDPAAMAGAITAVLQRPDEARRDVGRYGDVVDRTFDPAHIACQAEDIYRSTLRPSMSRRKVSTLLRQVVLEINERRLVGRRALVRAC
jgi:glycosyltransferase involved in cell wall biosynthesis